MDSSSVEVEEEFEQTQTLDRAKNRIMKEEMTKAPSEGAVIPPVAPLLNPPERFSMPVDSDGYELINIGTQGGDDSGGQPQIETTSFIPQQDLQDEEDEEGKEKKKQLKEKEEITVAAAAENTQRNNQKVKVKCNNYSPTHLPTYVSIYHILMTYLPIMYYYYYNYYYYNYYSLPYFRMRAIESLCTVRLYSTSNSHWRWVFDQGHPAVNCSKRSSSY